MPRHMFEVDDKSEKSWSISHTKLVTRRKEKKIFSVEFFKKIVSPILTASIVEIANQNGSRREYKKDTFSDTNHVGFLGHTHSSKIRSLCLMKWL